MGLALIFLVYLVRSLLTPFLMAAVVAYLAFPLVRTLEDRGVNRPRAIMTVYAAGLILAAVFVLLFVPTLFKETRTLENILPFYSSVWTDAQNSFSRWSDRVLLPPEVRQILMELSGHIRSDLLQGLRGFAESLLGLVSLLPSLLLAPFLAYYMIKDFEHFRKRFLAMFPAECRSELVRFMHEADLIFSRYLRGHLLVSAVVGFLTGLGAAIIGLQFFLLIGIFTALFDLVPFIGPFIAAFPVVGLALVEDRSRGILMLVVYIAVQQLEGSLLVPRLLGDQMGMHPLMIILVLLVGGYFFGTLGLIFAVPVACLLRVGLHMLWARFIGGVQ
jgi:predicted PurR-regulated permease PerM